jgi:hypothetical protein
MSISIINDLMNDLINFIEYILFNTQNVILLCLFIICIIVFFIVNDNIDITKLLGLLYQNIHIKYLVYIIILFFLGYYKQYNIIFIIIFLNLIIKFLYNIYESERIECNDKKCIVMTYPKLIIYIFIGIITLCLLTIVWIYIILKIILLGFIINLDIFTVALFIILLVLIYLIYHSLYSCFEFIKSLFKTKKIICKDKEILCYEYENLLNKIKYTYLLSAIMLIIYLSIIFWNTSSRFLNDLY